MTDNQPLQQRVVGAITDACRACREAGCDHEAEMIENRLGHLGHNDSTLHVWIVGYAERIFWWADKDASQGRLNEALAFERAGLALRSAAWFVAEAMARENKEDQA